MRHRLVFSSLLLLLLVALLAGLSRPVAAAPVNADAELKVSKEAYDIFQEDLWKEPDNTALLTAAYAAAKKTLKVDDAPALKLSGNANAQWATFAEAVRVLAKQANADTTENALRAAIIRAMADAVDDGHTAYLPKMSYDRARAETRGDLSIINYGFRRINVGDGVYIRSVVPGSNVARAGARDGDRLVAFDGKEVTKDNAAMLFANPKENDTHTFTVQHIGDAKPVDLKVTLRKYDQPTVTSRVIDGHIGYIQIYQFLTETPGKIDDALADFAKQGGINSLIIDVRGNPGGLATAEQRVTGRFLPNGTVFGSNIGRSYPKGNSVARSEGKTPSTLPLVVLMDDNSASASEYLALALRDFRQATLVGQKTVGLLGTATLERLSDGSAVEVTIAEYTTANGETLNGVGIVPDVEIPNPSDNEIIMGQDPQLGQAIAQANAKVGRQNVLPMPAALAVAA